MSLSNHPLYVAAIAADEALSAELVRIYGGRRASDMRYRSHRWTDDSLIEIAAAKHLADAAWLNFMRSAARVAGVMSADDPEFMKFQASGVDVADLSAHEDANAQGFEGPGRVYDGLVIQRIGDAWWLTIGNSQETATLTELEHRLYEWAVGEGLL